MLLNPYCSILENKSFNFEIKKSFLNITLINPAFTISILFNVILVMIKIVKYDLLNYNFLLNFFLIELKTSLLIDLLA